jgi:hypothetical protein
MNYFTYRKNLSFIFFFYLILIVVFGVNSYIGSSLIKNSLYFGSRIVFLYLLFFSIFALLSRVNVQRKLEKPIVFVIIGAIMVITSFAPPILAYFKSSEVRTDVFIKGNPEIKKEAISRSNTPERRYQAAENYYLATGERIPYLDSENREVIYTPDPSRSKLTEELRQSTDQLTRARANLRVTALSLLITLAFSVIIFIVFLFYKYKTGELGSR